MLYKKRAYDDKPADGGAPTAKQGRAGTQTRTYSVNQVGYHGEQGRVESRPPIVFRCIFYD